MRSPEELDALELQIAEHLVDSLHEERPEKLPASFFPRHITLKKSYVSWRIVLLRDDRADSKAWSPRSPQFA